MYGLLIGKSLISGRCHLSLTKFAGALTCSRTKAPLSSFKPQHAMAICNAYVQ